MTPTVDRILRHKPLMKLVNFFCGIMCTRARSIESLAAALGEQGKDALRARDVRLYFERSRWDIRAELEESGEGPEIERALLEATANVPPITVLELLDCALEHLAISRQQYTSTHDDSAEWNEPDNRLLNFIADAQERFALGLMRKMHFRGFEEDPVEVGWLPDGLTPAQPLRWDLNDELSLVLFAVPRGYAGRAKGSIALLGVEGVASAGARAMLLDRAAPVYRMLIPELTARPPKRRSKSGSMTRMEPLSTIVETMFCASPKKGLERAAHNAVILMAEAERQSQRAVGLALRIAAVEALLSGGAKEGIADRISRRAAVIFGASTGSRPAMKTSVKQLYNDRSMILHGTSLQVEELASKNARSLALATLLAAVTWLQRSTGRGGDWCEELDRCLETGKVHPLHKVWSKYLHDFAG